MVHFDRPTVVHRAVNMTFAMGLTKFNLRFPQFPVGLNERFPKNTARRNKWLAAVKRCKYGQENSPWEPSVHDRICGRHFIRGKSDDPHDPDYVPSVDMGNPYTVKEDPEAMKSRYERTVLRESKKQLAFKTPDVKKPDISSESDAVDALLDLAQLTPSLETPVHKKQKDIHDRCIKAMAEVTNKHQRALEEIGRLQQENRQLKEEIRQLQFSDEFLLGEKGDYKTSFFTGLPNHSVFLWLVNFTQAVLPKSNVLSPGSVLLIILMKLRLNLQNNDLAFRFNVSPTLISNILNEGLPKLANKIAFLVQWPDKESVIRNLPDIFRETYRKCNVIIDCCEVFVERAGNLTLRASTWSNYKHNNTVKFLVAITPTGAISFVSRAFGGRTSDKVITLRSGFLDLIEQDDQILADRGFLISEEVASRNATLIMPDFTRGKKQLSAREVERSRKIARVRIHVERAIERLKNFKILSSKINLQMIPHADNIMTICAAVSNLHPRLVN